jgi:predicted phage terminase large subunit-like protein
MAGWVHEDICRRLERFSDDVNKGLSPRLMLLMPPRHGKSEIASKTFPAWHLGRFPDHEIIACSYNVGLAMGFSRKVQQLFDDPAFQTVFDARLNPNHRAAEEWGVHGRLGGYVAAGVGGGITGKGAHVLIIDDPIKNAEEADSADIREKLWDWYGSTAYTRLAPGAGVLVIQTWWHDDDLAGKLQQAMQADPDADQFEIIKYPAIADQAEFLNLQTDEIIRVETIVGFDEKASEAQGEAVYLELMEKISRKAAKEAGHDNADLKFLSPKGASLHTARYDVKKLKRIKAVIPPRFWSALYQQNPVPDDGSFFTKDQFKRRDMAPPHALNDYVHVYQAWDFAISEKQQNDYTVGSVGIQNDKDEIDVPEVVRFKSGNSIFIVDTIIATAKRWYHPSLILGFEDGQIFRSIEALLRKRMEEEGFFVPYELLRPLTDKMARARPLQGRMQQGRVYFNSNGEWYETVRNEMLRFPAGVHDDCVDSLAWLAHLIVGKPAPSRPQPPKPKSWKDQLRGGTRGTGHMAA